MTTQSNNVAYNNIEKGLLLFVYLHEKSSAISSNARIWNKLRRSEICYHAIVRNQTHDPYYCQYDHSESYQQKNLCCQWYMSNCSKKSCQQDHFFISNKSKRFINNDTDIFVWNLIRFIRDFSLHFRQSTIDENDIHSLYEQILIIMIQIINSNSDKLNLFLGQLNEQFRVTEASCDIPETFLMPTKIKYNSKWYNSQSTKKIKIDFNSLSNEFKQYLANQFSKYENERLVNCSN